MNKLILYTSIAALTALTAGTGLAKDKDDKKKDKDRAVYVERDGRRYTVDRDGKRHWMDDGEIRRDRTRTIYVIERDRPVERVVYVDGDGRYYRQEAGRRVYVRERYFDAYPSKYYYPDGRRRITITLPF